MKSGFFNYFLKSYRVTFLIIVGLAALGIFTVLTLPRESTPEINIPFAAVVTVYPGAAARDVEELVTVPVEDELLTLDGLKQVTSSSSLGVSSVGVEFSADEDMDEALRRLRERVDQIRNLPMEVELPQVIELNFTDEPILSIGLGGIGDERLLAILADELANDLETIPGVSQVDVVGATEEEIKVVVDPARLADQGLSLGQIIGAIRAANINAPFGQLETERFNYDLRVVGRFADVSDVADIPVVRPDGVVVRLGTLANVSLELAERDTLSRISVGGVMSTPAVSLQVRKKTGGNIIRIVDAVEEKLAEAKRDRLPAEVQVVTFADRADEIRQSLSNVARSGAQTLVIVFGLLWLFLGWRPAIIASLAVPLTFSMSFLVFDLTGTTLNGISLFSLILSLGLLVDTTIVIVEGICSGRTKTNLTEHAAEVVDRFKKPLMGGTLTTVAAFFPMLLMTGIIGQFLKVIPTVVTATLIGSLFVALAFIPPVAVKLLDGWNRAEEARQHGGQRSHRSRWFDRVFAKLRSRYVSFISWALGSRRFQRTFIGVLALLLIAGLSLPFTGLLKTGLFPAVDIDFMIINIELPPGSQLTQTDKVLRQVEGMLHEVPEVESYVANGGSGVSFGFGGGGSSGEALGSFFINLDKERERSSLAITDELRDKLVFVTEAKIVVEEISAGPPSAPPVELQVIGDDLAEIGRVSQEIMDELAGIPGAIDIDRNLRNSAGEFNFVFDREALAAAGLSTADVTQLLRASVFGLEATSFLDEEGDEVAVRVEALEETVNSVDDVLAIPLLSPQSLAGGGTAGQAPLTVGQVAQVDLGNSFNTIRHLDGDRAVTVTANADEGVTPNEISEEIMRRIEEIGLPESVRVEFGGEQEETVETFQQLYRSMVIAVILILIILVVEFNSYRQPLIIFLSIPLALIGVLFGLLILGGQLNFASFIGLVSLTGIVVNNAIILVDRMNRMRAEGKSIIEAVKEASDSRLRPIILTTFTTAAGVAPLIWVDEFFRDMALTLITGLLFSSVITLVLIPILYLRQAQRIERKRLRRVVRG